ncbi:enoyl-CoA hydratase/isomerase family protein [Paraburkholderia caledonica]|jgi:enoyl-CoA hydratase/carnithine racemase|uniref:enoyl-CoA hydratase/isomerase family protein n=1 Tax=Paraburkholderia caledonica TaxID=134536 RepID=UPI000489A680|nr:enoyl-CoA hydratase-related protein [Paraburkholderia caledonica]
MSGNVRLSIEEGIAIITLDAPPFNLISREMTAALDDVLGQCDENAAVRVLILRGAGERAFCGGSDIKEFTAMMKPRAVIEHKLRYENLVYSKLADFRAPTIAAVDGLALGGGLELAACCDFIIAAEGVPLGLPETRLGIFPGSGGTVRVTRRIGPSRAKQMIFLGDVVPTDTALAWGLVDWVVPKEEVQAESRRLAVRLADASASGLSLAKRAIADTLDHPEAVALNDVLDLMDRAFCSADAKEGVSAFIAKRKPSFR